jgi:hypothetical protein
MFGLLQSMMGFLHCFGPLEKQHIMVEERGRDRVPYLLWGHFPMT